MVIARIRNIAEHAMVGDADDPLRNTRTTLANGLERAFVAPNYHLGHNLFYYVPCYKLPALHRILRAGPHGARMQIAPGYAALLRQAASRPDELDRPGALVHGLRRQVHTNANSEKAGF